MIKANIPIKEKPFLLYHGHGFTLAFPEHWHDQTIYTLTGPVTNGIQHNIIINVEYETTFERLRDYAEWQVRSLETELKAFVLLKKGAIKLTNGLDAYRTVFRWYPTDELRIYQVQIYVLHLNNAYKLTASFTKKTRKTLGPQIERMMLSFQPREYEL